MPTTVELFPQAAVQVLSFEIEVVGGVIHKKQIPRYFRLLRINYLLSAKPSVENNTQHLVKISFESAKSGCIWRAG